MATRADFHGGHRVAHGKGTVEVNLWIVRVSFSSKVSSTLASIGFPSAFTNR